MLFEVVVIALLGAFIQWLHSYYQSIWKHVWKIPGPSMLGLAENLKLLFLDQAGIYILMRRAFKRYNFSICRVNVGPKPIIFCLNPKSCETVLSGKVDSMRQDMYKFFKPWFPDGPFTSNGTLWKMHRNLVYASINFDAQLPVINKCGRNFCKYLETFADSGEIIDIQELVPLFTFDSLCENAFGVEFKTSEGKHSPMIKAIDDMCDIVAGRAFSIFKQSDLLFYFSQDYRRQQESVRILHQELQKVLDDRRKHLSLNTHLQKTGDSDKRPPMIYLDSLISSVIDGEKLTDHEIIGSMTAAIFGGHDTLVTPLSFAIFCLSRHPEVQEKAFQEQFKFFGNNNEQDLTHDDSKNMPYLDMIIKETLRLFSTAPFILRTTSEAVEIEGYLVPKGVSVVIAIIALATDERNFKEPFKFRPERFDPKEREHAKPYDYLPFSAGPRGCPGQKIALLEIKTCLSKMLRKFEMLPPVAGLSSGIHDPHDDIDFSKNPYDPILTVAPALKSINGVQMRLRRRIY